MSSNKFLIGTLVGGITFFLLGYLFYGLALSSFFMNHTVAPSGSMKTMDQIVWWALILGNLTSAALLSYIFLKLGNISSFGSGARTGASIGFFMSLSMGLVRFATENSLDITGTLTDVVVGTVMTAIAGGVIGALFGRGKKKA
jgi:arginine exporter protein ArgO